MILYTKLTGIALATVLAFSSIASAGHLNRKVRIVNKTGFTIIEFYGSNKGSRSWEEDILGADVIPSGSYMNINFDDGTGYCKFDFKAVFSDGDVLVEKNINICEVGTYTYR